MGLPELGMILLVVLVLFGGSQLPKLARSLGQAQKEFKSGLDEGATPAAAPKDAPAPKDEDTPSA